MPTTKTIMPKSHIEVTEPDFYVFLRISAHLTGFSEEELLGTGMHETYYYTIMKEQDQDMVRSFFRKANEILVGKTEIKEKIVEHFIPRPEKKPPLAPPHDTLPYAGLAKRITLLWYTGIWTTMNWKDEKPESARTAMVSPEAYAQGLIWVAAETHPAGAKQPGYNSWNRPPYR
jgi:hypothetical protein